MITKNVTTLRSVDTTWQRYERRYFARLLALLTPLQYPAGPVVCVQLGDDSDVPILKNDYYKLIEAVEFTRQMDDGARPERWKDTDILILGVSRTGKTPLSIYLGQRGYKVANLPLVPRDGKLMVPKQISDVDPSRVFGLLIDGDVLHSIRTNRLSSIGVRAGGADAATNARREYSAMRQVTQELSLAKALYARNPEWEVLDVTHRGVEETAAKILRKMFTSENANNFQGMVST